MLALIARRVAARRYRRICLRTMPRARFAQWRALQRDASTRLCVLHVQIMERRAFGHSSSVGPCNHRGPCPEFITADYPYGPRCRWICEATPGHGCAPWQCHCGLGAPHDGRHICESCGQAFGAADA